MAFQGRPTVLGTRHGVSGRQGRRALGTRPVSWARFVLGTPAGVSRTPRPKTTPAVPGTRRVLRTAATSQDATPLFETVCPCEGCRRCLKLQRCVARIFNFTILGPTN